MFDATTGYDAYCCEDFPDSCCNTIWSFWWFWIVWISLFMCFGACCWVCRQQYSRRRRFSPQQQYIIIPQPTSQYGGAVYGTVGTSSGFVSSAPPRPPAYTADKPPAYATGPPPEK
ncbi:hypothetical protein NP493_89g02055 [Ridgeia piscesae]|uniref:Vesicular, overexpressed in cancer, prosurvival protein 1 n=1 Tax=Ridgeia piscesae TaxID=27915 RepID=A0AAD9UHY1_RIDPI|nr:hypothetical protein NP493_89g02055 [Ridgeia piscesae]